MALSVDIEKKLGNFRLRVAFETEGGVLALLGASGCGKSMTLKCIAGIEKPDRGRIVLDGVTLFDSEKRVNLPPQKRRVGYLFQQYALFPNMTVAQNIRCGVRDRSRAEAALRDIIPAMHLEGLESHRPAELSGGQQQRVALARILVNEPQLLLLDEPFSALDSQLRFRLEEELRHAIGRFGKSVLLVSHNRDEVFRLSDDIAVMNHGNIEAIGHKADIFADPVTRHGAVMTGCKNISAVERLDEGRLLAVQWGMELRSPKSFGEAKYIGIRMHDICPAAPGETENVFACRVAEELENPFSVTVMLRPKGKEDAEPLGWELDKALWASLRGETVSVRLPGEALLPLEE